MGALKYQCMERPGPVPHGFAMPKPPAQRRKNYIAQWRRFRNSMTQEELADRAQLSAPGLSQIETGKVNYTHESLGRIAEALGCTRGDLLEVDPFAIDELGRLTREMSDPSTRRRAARLLEALLKAD